MCKSNVYVCALSNPWVLMRGEWIEYTKLLLFMIDLKIKTKKKRFCMCMSSLAYVLLLAMVTYVLLLRDQVSLYISSWSASKLGKGC